MTAFGVQPGERIGTLAWNGYRHMEMYFGVSGMGAVLHTINPRLFPEQIEYIVNHAEDQYLFFDLSFANMDRIEPELALKTTPLRSQKGSQQRERLSVDAPELADKMAIAVQAPAGFGKTMLLAQWRREFLSRGAVVAWLTLDGRDEGGCFSQGLAAAMALGSGRPSFAGAGPRMSGKGRDELEGLTDWLAEVADLAGETVLILNEVDALPEETICQCLAYLLHNALANLRIIMSSRGRPGLNVVDLLVRGLYVQVAVDSLRFRVEETVVLLSNRFGARIDADRCLRLHEITEGWPLGLQLAIAAIEKCADLEAAIERLSACSGDIQRYVVDSLVATPGCLRRRSSNRLWSRMRR